MEQMISSQSLTYMAFEICIACTLPIIVAIVWKIKKQAEWLPIISGMCVYFGIVIVGSKVLDFLFLGTNTVLIELFQKYWMLGVIYSAMLFAVLEGIGRFICLKYIVGDNTKKTTSVSYGIGHGGLESMYVLAYPLFTYFMVTFQMNELGMDGLLEVLGDKDPTPYLEIISAIQGLTVEDVFFVFAERSLFLLLQIGLSVLVFSAIHYSQNKKLFPLSILLHFIAISAINMITLQGMTGQMVKLGVLIGMVLFVLFIARFYYITMEDELI